MAKLLVLMLIMFGLVMVLWWESYLDDWAFYLLGLIGAFLALLVFII